jgi:hypothetical protein
VEEVVGICVSSVFADFVLENMLLEEKFPEFARQAGKKDE